MSVAALTETRSRPPSVVNLPNILTMTRLLLAIVLFAFMEWEWLRTSLVLFMVAASTDWLDGYVARKRGETTKLGRILDPFVDKVIIIGAFTFLIPVANSGVSAWMVTVVVARELLVTVIRSFLEGESIAFGADWWGKIKMGLQCLAVGAVLFNLGVLQRNAEQIGLAALTPYGFHIQAITIWLAVVSTVISGLNYVARAIRLVQQRGSDSSP